jgi:hypothetical protein
MKKQALSAIGAGLLVSLSGCGAVSSIVNTVIPEIKNLAALDGKSVDATVGSGRAVISASVTKTATFRDRNLPQVARLRRVKLRQGVNQRVVATFPPDFAPPPTFTLKNLSLTVRFSDSETRVAEATASVAGPLVFVRDGDTSTYSLTTPVEVKGLTFDGAEFATIRDIITTEPGPNSVTARFSLDADDTELPRGTVLKLSLEGGRAKVEI